MDELLFKGLGSTANKKVPSVRRNRSDNCELAESQSSSRRRWPSYGENDVLVGRGRGCTSHSGNKRYLDIVESYMISYTRAKGREEQRHIKMSILDAVRGAGGRFLKPVKGSKEHSWEELSLTAVLDKIAQVRTSKSPCSRISYMCTHPMPTSTIYCSRFATKSGKGRVLRNWSQNQFLAKCMLLQIPLRCGQIPFCRRKTSNEVSMICVRHHYTYLGSLPLRVLTLPCSFLVMQYPWHLVLQSTSQDCPTTISG
jgi:hypothetical protein